MPEFLNSPVDMALGAILGMAVPWVMIGLIWWWLTRPTTGAVPALADGRPDVAREPARLAARGDRGTSLEADPIKPEARHRLGLQTGRRPEVHCG
jgi:hypothetical protein